MNPYDRTAQLIEDKYPSSIANSVHDEPDYGVMCFATGDEDGVVLIDPIVARPDLKYPQADLFLNLQQAIQQVEKVDNSPRGRTATAALLNALSVWNLDFQLNR